MSLRQEQHVLAARDEVVAAPTRQEWLDYGFELPTGVYAAMATLFFGFLAVMAIGFASPGLVIPMAICFAFLTAFFAVPAIFVRSAPATAKPSMLWSELMRHGIDTQSGRASGHETVVLVLLLPTLIFAWAIAVVTIAAII